MRGLREDERVDIAHHKMSAPLPARSCFFKLKWFFFYIFSDDKKG